MTAFREYSVEIKTEDPSRYLPLSWRVEAKSDDDAWRAAIALTSEENVTLVGVYDDLGRSISRTI